jgi:hypothetical protein
VLQARGEVSAALQAYDSAFANVPWGIWSISEAAELALSVGDTSRALAYLETLYARGGEPLITYSESVQALNNLMSQAALERAHRAKTRWAAQSDSIWIKALLEMRELDQVERSDKAISLRNDSINILRMLQLTEERGYPSEARVGSSAGIVTLLFWHHWLELGKTAETERFWTLTEQAIDRGEVPPDYLCSFVDRGEFDAGRPMRYGTLLSYFRNEKNIQFIERQELNKNRASVGLESIENFAFLMEIDLDTILSK